MSSCRCDVVDSVVIVAVTSVASNNFEIPLSSHLEGEVTGH